MIKKTYWLLALLIFCNGAFAAVWDAENHWSAQWEQKFSKWVEEYWVPEIFSSPSSPYFDIATDCADAAYDMRLIFSFENSLPFVINDPSSAGGLISNKMKQWDHLSQKERVRALIHYVNDVTTTDSIPGDTYPIPLNKNTIKPGVIYVKPGSHAFQIVGINEYGVPRTLSSTVPRVARELYIEDNFPSFVPSDEATYRDGYRRFRWPEDLKLPVTKVPGFDREQYRLARLAGSDYVRFTDKLLQRLGGKPEPAPLRTRRFMYNLCYAARRRAEILGEAEKYRARLRSSGRRCMTPAEYYDYSTDGRDARLKSYFEYVKGLIGTATWSDADWRKSTYRHEYYLKPYAEAIFRIEDGDASRKSKRTITDGDLIAWCGVEYKPGTRISLREIWRSILDKTLSPDPNDSLERRWGRVAGQDPTGCPRY